MMPYRREATPRGSVISTRPEKICRSTQHHTARADAVSSLAWNWQRTIQASESLVNNPDGQWRQIAVVEVATAAPDMASLIGESDSRYRVTSALASPTGYKWYEIELDFSIGEARASQAACALLRALADLGSAGIIPEYRLVGGQQWLEVGANLERMSDAMHARPA